MIKLQSFWGSAPDPDGGAYSAPPYPLAGLRGGVAPSRTHPSCRKPPRTIPGYATECVDVVLPDEIVPP